VVIISRLMGLVVAGTGFAALMTVVLVGQGTILLTLGILGEYLWRAFDEVRGRPRFIIEEQAPARRPGLAAAERTGEEALNGPIN
jgi:dolichol-phosphate mannosyltransferase